MFLDLYSLKIRNVLKATTYKNCMIIRIATIMKLTYQFGDPILLSIITPTMPVVIAPNARFMPYEAMPKINFSLNPL